MLRERLIRYTIAYVFITSGLMKLFNAELSSYFLNLGLPFPLHFMYLLAFVEILSGCFIALNKFVREASIPLIFIMIGALLLTKVPSLHTGFLSFAFGARLDIVMLLLLFIVYTERK